MNSEWIPYGKQSIDDEDISAVMDSLRSGWLTTGPAVEAFEKALEAHVGAPAVAVSSGTAALHAAYAAAGLEPGTELITSPMTFVATASAAVHLGAEVRFADVSEDDLNIDPDAVQALTSQKTRVIAAVDFAGHPADLDPLASTADEIEATLVEDASHSLGAAYKSHPVGSVADLTTFSFHPVKAITTGEGGAVSSHDPHLLESVRRFRNHGLVRDSAEHRIRAQGSWHQEVHKLGLNYRLADPLAALGTAQLKKLDHFIERRNRLADRYRILLGSTDGIRLPVVSDDVDHAWHLYTVRILDGRRREVFDHLRSRGIGVQVHYLPVHLHPSFSEMGYRMGMCPVSERAYEELISLPLFPSLSEDSQDRVVGELQAALAS